MEHAVRHALHASVSWVLLLSALGLILMLRVSVRVCARGRHYIEQLHYLFSLGHVANDLG
jgi:hypothetical protein